ncbi:MAG: MaoC family dehydratase [Dehalococcoidia bacterium]|nr:MaoC family dehydratase [Dehalococcoidia bacterium]
MDPGFQLGAKGNLSKTITEADVAQFARISGDTQPLHLDESYASKTRFKTRVAHGTISIGLVSGVLGTKMAGPATSVIFLGMNCRFVAPVYLGDTVSAECVVTKVRPDKPIITLDCKVKNQHGQEVLTGEATVLLDSYPTPSA